MKSFILGACVGLTLAGAVGAGAQLVPFDAPLSDQIQAQRSEWYLRMQRDVEQMERDTRRLTEERLPPLRIPAPDRTVEKWIEQREAAQRRADQAEADYQERKLDRMEREVQHLELLNALDDLKRRH